MNDEHEYYSDQCSGCKWAEWRGGCLNKATAEDGSDLDAADRGQCDHFEAGDPQKRPPQPGDRVHVQMSLDDYTALRTNAEAAEAALAAARAELVQARADARLMVAQLTVDSGVWQSCMEAADWYAIHPDHEVIAVLSRAEITAVIHRCAALPSIRPAEWAATGEPW